MTAPTNMAASVKARLLSVAKQRGEEFNLLLIRYGIERLLYRLSESRHSESFLLKGAMLFAIWDSVPHRPTHDLDLLGFGPVGQDELVAVFRDIAGTPVAPDGLNFDPDSVSAEPIREDNVYGGTRVRLVAWLGKAEVPIQVDVGAGDAVTPRPEIVEFPVLLDFPAPTVQAYPAYTVIAEKVEAAVKLKEGNSRMKDFYDLWFLSRHFDFNGQTLRRAIEATFTRRRTPLPASPEPFTDALANNPTKQTQWAAFLRRNRLSGIPEQFAALVEEIVAFIGPVLYGANSPAHWHAPGGWRR